MHVKLAPEPVEFNPELQEHVDELATLDEFSGHFVQDN